MLQKESGALVPGRSRFVPLEASAGLNEEGEKGVMQKKKKDALCRFTAGSQNTRGPSSLSGPTGVRLFRRGRRAGRGTGSGRDRAQSEPGTSQENVVKKE